MPSFEKALRIAASIASIVSASLFCRQTIIAELEKQAQAESVTQIAQAL